jgi:hypothetical protein
VLAAFPWFAARPVQLWRRPSPYAAEHAMTTMTQQDDFSAENRASLYHWAIAVAIALAVHAALAATLLLWYTPAIPGRPPDAIAIDLVPPPAPVSPAVPQAEQRPAPEQAVAGASSDQAIEQPQIHVDQQAAVASQQKPAPRPVEESAAPAKPTAPAEQGPTQENAQAAPVGAPAGAVQPGAGAGAPPIDFRIAEQHRTRVKRSAWKDAIMGRTPKGYGLRQQPPGPSAPNNMARNAIGMAVPDGTAAAKGLGGYSLSNGRDGVPRNAVGAGAAESVVGRTAPGVSPNAIAVNAANHATVVGLNIARPTVGAVPAVRPISNAGINGTTMIRPGTSTGAIGGPSRAAGVINGTSIRLRP